MHGGASSTGWLFLPYTRRTGSALQTKRDECSPVRHAMSLSRRIAPKRFSRRGDQKTGELWRACRRKEARREESSKCGPVGVGKLDFMVLVQARSFDSHVHDNRATSTSVDEYKRERFGTKTNHDYCI